MRSKHVDMFNHDPWAGDYDSNVNNSNDPVRHGYWETLRWVVARARIGKMSTVLDLGAGTGNTSSLIPHAKELICVDISRNLLEQAPAKLAHLDNISYVVADLLEYWQHPGPRLDAVVSTYAVHHLTTEEKGVLVEEMAGRMAPGAIAAFGDLMFESALNEEQYRQQYRATGHWDVVEAIGEEWFWHLDVQKEQLGAAGFDIVGIRRFSDLSWGIAAVRTG